MPPADAAAATITAAAVAAVATPRARVRPGMRFSRRRVASRS